MATKEEILNLSGEILIAIQNSNIQNIPTIFDAFVFLTAFSIHAPDTRAELELRIKKTLDLLSESDFWTVRTNLAKINKAIIDAGNN